MIPTAKLKHVVPIIALALLAVGAGAKTAADRSSTFHVVADTIEGCSCPLFCGCYFNGEPDDPHMCQFNNVYKFQKGSHYGDVDLGDAIVWMSGDLGGEWGKSAAMPTEWVTITFDRKTTPEQRKAIGAVFAKVFPVQWKKQNVREDDIEWSQGPKVSMAKQKSGQAEITLEMWKGANEKEPTVLKNVQYWGSNSNEGFVLAKSTHRFDGGDVKFSHKQRNGFTIRWTIDGKVESGGAPAKASSGQP
jgi:hypothetical protein